MKLIVFALYDTITEEYGAPMLAKTKGHMARILKDNLKSPQDAVDYEIWALGTYDTEKGTLVPYDAQERVNLGLFEQIEELSEKAKQRQRDDERFMRQGGPNG